MKTIKFLVGILLLQMTAFELFGQYADPYFVGHNNTLLGRGALKDYIPLDADVDQYGTNCTAIGFFALGNHAPGGFFLYLDGSDAIDNTAIGAYSMLNTTVGSFNTGVGNKSLYSNVWGAKNVALGYESLKTIVSGSYKCCSRL